MSNVINFDFESSSIRVIDNGGEALFVARDVATVLGYARPTKAVQDHCRGVLKQDMPSSSGIQTYSVIKEPDVYRLIMKSKLQEAEKFEVWVFEEVLPRIRKTGGYIQNEENFQSEEELIYHAMQMMERKIREMKPKAEWFDEYVDNNGTLNTTDVAKQLGISAQALNKWMREKGIKFKDKTKDMPRNEYVDWFKMFNFNSHGKVGMQCRITTEGATKIVDMYKKSA